MKRVHFVLALTMGSWQFVQASWQTSIAQHKNYMNQAVYAQLKAQQEAYAQGKAPKIANPAIKTIPIVEQHESLIDVSEMQDIRVTMLPKPSHAFASPDCHSGFDAASKIRRTLFVKLQAMVTQLDLLAPQFGYQKGQIIIKVFEGLRDIKTQQMLFDNKAKEIHDAQPHMSEEEVYNETCKWVSPVRNNTPVHSTGGAVDIRLWNNKTQKFIDMGLFGVIWGKNNSAPTFSEDITAAQRNNRLYQMIAAANAGLTNYVYEFWHFSCGDRYAAYWQEPAADKRSAVYDAVQSVEKLMPRAKL